MVAFVPTPYERLKRVVQTTSLELKGGYGRPNEMVRSSQVSGKCKELCDDYRESCKVKVGNSYIPVNKRKITESVSRDIGEQVTQLFKDNDYKLDTGATSKIAPLVLKILREEWSRIEYHKAVEENQRIERMTHARYDEMLEYVDKICDECLLGVYDNPIKELRRLREMEWAKSILSR